MRPLFMTSAALILSSVLIPTGMARAEQTAPESKTAIQTISIQDKWDWRGGFQGYDECNITANIDSVFYMVTPCEKHQDNLWWYMRKSKGLPNAKTGTGNWDWRGGFATERECNDTSWFDHLHFWQVTKCEKHADNLWWYMRRPDARVKSNTLNGTLPQA